VQWHGLRRGPAKATGQRRGGDTGREAGSKAFPAASAAGTLSSEPAWGQFGNCLGRGLRAFLPTCSDFTSGSDSILSSVCIFVRQAEISCTTNHKELRFLHLYLSLGY
jgi:hypothetical protein